MHAYIDKLIIDNSSQYKVDSSHKLGHYNWLENRPDSERFDLITR